MREEATDHQREINLRAILSPFGHVSSSASASLLLHQISMGLIYFELSISIFYESPMHIRDCDFSAMI
jgi:hypothetical protein